MAQSRLKMTSSSARSAIFVVVGTALWFLTLGLVLYEFDRQYYMGAKRQIIFENSSQFFPPPDQLAEPARATLFARTPEESSRAAGRLSELLRKIVDGPGSVFSFQLFDPRGNIVLEVDNPSKPKRLNSWRNSLFLRDFVSMSAQNISRPGPADEPRQVGRLSFHYTSPAGFGPIEELTRRYRVYAMLIVGVWVFAYYVLYRYLLRPVQTVTTYVDRSLRERPQLILRASGPLEKSYNNIATRAILQQIQEKLTLLVRQDLPEGRADTMDEALRMVRETFGVQHIVVTELTEDEENPTVLDQSLSPPDAPPLDASFRMRLGTDEHESFSAAAGEFYFESRLAESRLVISGRMRTHLPDVAFRTSCMEQVCRAIRDGLLTFRAHQQNVLRQRSEANIVLSKNLGHDLTNIIATSKLDLLAVRQVLNSGEMDGTRADLLRQSVEGLLDTTKFLQEIVNIYRSFSYVKRPQYERHHLNDLIEQFLLAFEPSVSTRVTVERLFAKDLPSLILEPRLLKLALFNVLTNALDAIKRDYRPGAPAPTVRVVTSRDGVSGEFRIEIEDNGPGIRDAGGRLLRRDELERIFQYGYSTKAENSEGLGLNWVRSIVEDFHAGEVRAENLSPRGARITLAIRSMEAAEAHIGQERPAARQ